MRMCKAIVGTNFYTVENEERGQHIGKRSAAGAYCWDCNITLCRGGNGAIHTADYGNPLIDHKDFMQRFKEAWHQSCPRCGQSKQQNEGFEDSAAGRELGFNTNEPTRKTGVRSCSLFIWDVSPGYLEGVRDIRDEYGRLYTRAEFMQMLEECPVQFTDSIGKEFS